MWDNKKLLPGRAFLTISFALILALSGAPEISMAQTLQGSVVGIITDSSGALIPNVKVVLTEVGTGVHHFGETNHAGVYTFADVKAGTYTVEATAPGFKKVTSSQIIVLPTQVVRFDSQLEVGQLSDTVEVKAQAPTLNTENAQLGDIRTRDELVNLPLNSRSAMSFRYITSSNYDGGYIAGQRSSFGYYSVDGVTAMSPAWGAWSGPVMTGMSMEAIQDITFVTATPTAEYGDLATISLSSRSGTNQFHGSGFWEHSNYAFNAAGYFSHAKGKGPVTHQFGGSLGGPVILPKLYNGKNRTFFFFTWENLIAPGGAWSLTSVPTAKMRNGDFSELDVTVYDPTTGVAFPSNQIPSSRISSISSKIQNTKYIPLPNYGSSGSISNNYRNFYSNRTNSYFSTVRGDHTMRDGKDSISGRLNYRHDPEGGNLNGLPFFNDTQFRNVTNAYVSETHLFSPQLVNQFRVGFNRDYSLYAGTSLGSDVVSDWGLSVPNMSGKTGLHGTPYVAISDFQTLWSYADTMWAHNTIDIVDNLTWSRGRHIIKFGGNYRHYQVDQSSGGNKDLFGTLDFTSFGSRNTSGNGGFGYASFLLGLPFDSATHDRSPDTQVRYRTLSAYVQDDWRVNSRLTLNFGLRWEYTSTPVDVNDMRFTFDPTTGNLVVPTQKVKDTLVSSLFPSSIPIVTASQAGFDNARSLISADHTWGPRFGFAYRFNNKTVLRGGAGLYYTPLLTYIMIDPYSGGPFELATSYTNQLTNGTASFTIANAFSPSTSGEYAGGVSISTGVSKVRTPYSEQWNLTLERQFGESTVVRANYRGHHTTQLLYYPDLNQPHVSNNPDNEWNVVYDNFWNVYVFRNGGSEIGHLLEFELQRKYAKGLTFQAGYTHAKVVTDSRDSDIVAWPEYSWDLRRDTGNENGIPRHRFTASAVWELPFGSGKRFGSTLPAWVRQSFGNWQTSYIVVFQSGRFLNAYCGDCADTSYARVYSGRPDLIGNPKLDNAAIGKWYNVSAFRAPATGTLGNSSPGVVVGPGLANLDFGLFKYFNLTERSRLQMRMTSTNFFNHPNLSNPNMNISSVNAGKITGVTSYGAGGGARTIKLGLRFEF